MKRAAALAGALLMVGLVALPGTALADHNPNGRRLKFEHCPPDEGSMMMSGTDCIYDTDGHITGRGEGLDLVAGSGFGGFFVLAIFFAIIWAAIPALIASNMAKERGESPGAAAALAFFGGWVGLAAVYLKGRGSSVIGGSNSPLVAPSPSTSQDPSDRIRKLQMMKDQGLITDAEYQARRKDILNSI